ncbi:MAG: PSD1 and planctomycete cytochrome C domain-containing protein [Planctomycetota bacterium]|nr:PSD1 and planctomycete cytochrome C domain-containing protein [Planctomycetota bacterium]
MTKRYRLASLVTTAICLTTPLLLHAADSEPSPSFSSEEIDFFEKKIRPLLAERCYTCHSQQAETKEGGLRLDSRRAMLVGGETGPAIVPGNSDQSLLIESIHYGGTYEMPPDSKLPPEAIELLDQWVRMGAPWPEEDSDLAKEDENVFSVQQRKESHWCWQPLQVGSPPVVHDVEWPREFIDLFILQKIEAAGLKPAAEADRHQWLRRVTFDLIGLPPTLDEMENFLADSSPYAYARVVDRLLASPRFGEHWARYWMDIIRYGETKAFAQDYSAPFVFRYRDYLIRAYNTDVGYDQFVREALAGDLIEEPRVDPLDGSNESVMGPGYVYLTDGHHGPADIHADEARVFDTIIDTTGKAFLGLTLSCCRCHDHKFDALSMQDYYSLYGVISSSRIDYANTVSEERCEQLKSDLQERKAVLQNAILTQIQAEHAKRNLTDETACSLLCDQLKTNETWQQQGHPLYALTAVMLAEDTDARRDVWDKLKQISASERQTDLQSITSSGPDAPSNWFASGNGFDPDRRPPGTMVIAPSGNAILNALVGSSWAAGDLTSRLAGSLKSPTFLLPEKISLRVQGRHGRVRLYVQHYEMVGQGPTTTSLDIPVQQDTWHWVTFDTRLWQGKRAYLELLQNGDQMQFVSRKQHEWKHEDDSYLAVDRIVFGPSDQTDSKVSSVLDWKITGDSPASLTDAAAFFSKRIKELLEEWKAGTVDRGGETILAALFAAGGLWEVQADRETPLEQHVNDYRRQMQSIPPPVYARSLADGPGEDEAMHIRGNPAAPSKAPANRHFLDAFAPEPFTVWGSGRKQWTDAALGAGMPLTARVEANRIWYRLFGRGLVESVDNFGVKGSLPSHPELLDRLALDFVDSGWSRKALIRKLVLSSTYRMSTRASAKSFDVDPDNVLLQHANVRRLPAEAIRDAVLATSGSLNDQMYGPGVPLHLGQMPPSRARPLKSGPLDGNRRRAVYQEMRRNYLPPLLLAFDLPQAAVALGKRGVTNVPAQSLAMLNDPFIIQQADRWADQIMNTVNLSTEERIDRVHRIALSRPATEKEIDLARHMLNYFEENASVKEKSDLKSKMAWQSLCHLMFNRKEFIFIR